MRHAILSALVVLAAPLATSFGARAQPFELDGNELKVPSSIVFKTAGAELLPESDAALAHVAAYLAAKDYISTLRVEVHSDATGSADFNQALTEKRALAVARALVDRGVDCKRLLPVGFGHNKPVAPNDTPEGRAQNRRTSFFNAALKGRPIGGMPVDGGGKVAGDPCAR